MEITGGPRDISCIYKAQIALDARSILRKKFWQEEEEMVLYTHASCYSCYRLSLHQTEHWKMNADFFEDQTYIRFLPANLPQISEESERY